MTLGPLEYTVIGFDGNRFNGEIAKEIGKVVDSGTIALVDVVFITKDIDGNASVVEIDAKDDPRFAHFAPMLDGLMGLLTPEDIDQIAEGPRPTRPPSCSCSSTAGPWASRKPCRAPVDS